MKRWAAGSLVTLIVLSGCGGGGGTTPPAAPGPANDVSVQTSAPAKAVTGKTAEFTSVVTNAGPDAATGVALSLVVSGGLTPSSIDCVAAGGAVCPGTSTSMSVPSLPMGGTLTFTTTVEVPANGSGPLQVRMESTTADDTAAGNNASAAQTPIVDSYTTFASDGIRYTLEIDRDAKSLSITDPAGSTQTRSFTGTANPYTIDPMQQFRIGDDLVVGSLDFGSGVLPFVAARKFITAVADLPNYRGNVLSRVMTSPGVYDTQIYTMAFNGGQLMQCRGNNVMRATVGACTAPNTLYTYVLTPDGDEFTGVDAAHGNDSVRFSIAMSGTTPLYLLAANGTTNTNNRLRIGLPEQVSMVPGPFTGGSTRGENALITTADNGGLTEVNVHTEDSTGASYDFGFNNGPMATPGLAVGSWTDTRTATTFGFWTMNSPVLSVFISSRGSPDWAAGFMVLGAP